MTTMSERLNHEWTEADGLLGDESERFCTHCSQMEENNTAECSVRLREELASLETHIKAFLVPVCVAGDEDPPITAPWALVEIAAARIVALQNYIQAGWSKPHE
jgi:hypothetical protein